MASRVAKVSANTLTRTVTPIVSSNANEARNSVLSVYKQIQRLVPKFWLEYGLKDMPVPVLRAVIKKQFTNNAHLSDVRIIDRKVIEAYKDIESVKYYYYNTYHVRNRLFHDNIESKPKDFLSRFLNNKE